LSAERVARHRERKEQEIRDSYGYGSSEKRTQAERNATAKRILEKADRETESRARAIWASAADTGMYDLTPKTDVPDLKPESLKKGRR
jgi:hypothetical protein